MRRRGRGGDPVRRRHQRRRRRRAADRRRLRRRGHDRPAARSTGCSRSTRSRARRGSRPGRSARRSRSSSREHGLTLRHFPQSFEFSTLGGWIATRAGGHFATLYTHIDDLVESVRAITPAGDVGEPPAAGLGRRAEPGPDADRLRGHPRGDHRGLGAGARRGPAQALVRRRVRRPSRAGAEAVRALAQSGLNPANCRLLDATEAAVTHAGARGQALLVLGFESAHLPVDGRWSRRSSSPATTAARPPASAAARGSAEAAGDAVGAWRHAFLAAPYLRDTLRRLRRALATPSRPRSPGTGLRTSTRGDRVARRRSPRSARRRRRRGAPRDRCRFTHVYPDGAGALLHDPRAGAPRRRARAVGRDQGRGLRGADRRRRDDHPPPRGRAATTGPGTTASARSRSPRRCGPPSARSIPRGILNPGC